MEKIAILVLANAQSMSLRKFAHVFDADRFTFYVHLDARRDLAGYLGGEAMPDHVRFVDNRLPIYWGGFSMIRATEIMALEALQDVNNIAFALVSDDSFPLLSKDRLYEEVCTKPDRIDTWAIGPSHRNFERYHRFFDLDSSHGSARFLPVEERFIGREDLKRYERLSALMGRGKAAISICSGSQWWSLGRSTLEQCVSRLRQDIHLRESFEFSAIPDEMVFQTLARETIPAGTAIAGTPMAYDFSKNPKPFVYTNIDELELRLLNNKLFIRKVAADENFLNAILERAK